MFCRRCDLCPPPPHFPLRPLDRNMCKDAEVGVEVRVWEQDVLVWEHGLCGQDTLGLADSSAEAEGDTHRDAESALRHLVSEVKPKGPLLRKKWKFSGL